MIGARLLRQLQRFDWILFLSVVVLFALGISAIYSVELSQGSNEFALVRKHAIAIAIGLTLLFAAANSNYLLLRNYGRGLYLVGVLMMLLVLFFGRELNGTTGWFIIGSLSFQPVELMKFALVVQLARYFGEHARRRFGWREIFGSGILVAIPVGLTMLQPDLGSAVLLIAIWGIVMFFAGIRAYHVAILGGAGILLLVISWFFLLADYQKTRVEVFMNPELDPLATGYNITQAKIAIGSGQLTGRGLGFGSQSQLKFLPESQTDFIFAVIAEELGFIGVLIILAAFAVLFWRVLLSAARARDNFTGFLAVGLFATIFVQMSVNIGVNLSILPATGVGLPFVSYGGSSLIMFLTLIGVAESIQVRLDPAQNSSSFMV